MITIPAGVQFQVLFKLCPFRKTGPSSEDSRAMEPDRPTLKAHHYH